jgi:hypothetical protein
MNHYIMDENMFTNLSCVRGFTNLNGKTYLEHIVIIFKLEGTDKEKILNSKSIEEAKTILKNDLNINYTHNF